MGLLVFVVVAAIVVGGPLIWMTRQMRRRPGETKMVLLGSTSGETEKALWVGALRSAGISSHVNNVGDYALYGPTAVSYEVWVPARDERRAREVLGL